MLWINKIREMFNVDEKTAREIMNRMVLDFSECTWEQFEREAQFIYDYHF